METKHLIIGNGQIGSSVYEVLKEVADVQIRGKESDIVGQFNYLHIAIPFLDQETFIKIVKEYEELYRPHTIVVHSTVGVGTIRLLGESCVHAPIRGRHPNLAESIRTFRLYIGGNDISRIKAVAEIFKLACKDVAILDRPPETTELLKILDTTYYGWNILFAKEVYRLCKQFGVEYDDVYTDANNSYNKGYQEMGEPQFTRPVLKHMPGKIGGHCVSENSILFPDTYVTQKITEMNKEVEDPNSIYYEPKS